jgi:hypothetical protein
MTSIGTETPSSQSTPTPSAPSTTPAARRDRRIKAQLFRLLDHTANLRRTPMISRIWDFGGEYYDIHKPNGPHYWICDRCDSVHSIPTNKSTSSMIRHLKRKHRIVIEREARASSQVQSIEEEVSMAEERASVTTPARFQAVVHTVNVDLFRQKLIKWVIRHRVPFRGAISTDFRDLLITIQPSIEKVLPVTHQTIANWVLATYYDAQETIKERLSKAKSQIHLSFDGWPSPSCKGFLGVAAHFLGEEYELEHLLIGFREVEGRHIGENIAEVLLRLIEEYELEDDLGCFVADNASNNDTAIEEVLTKLNPNCTKEEVLSRRSRCLGHIINLAAKAFIFGKDIEGFEAVEEMESLRLDYGSERSQARWREKGPIGKFHNVVVFVKSSVPRKQEFRKHLKVVVDRIYTQGEYSTIRREIT